MPRLKGISHRQRCARGAGGGAYKGIGLHMWAASADRPSGYGPGRLRVVLINRTQLD